MMINTIGQEPMPTGPHWKYTRLMMIPHQIEPSYFSMPYRRLLGGPLVLVEIKVSIVATHCQGVPINQIQQQALRVPLGH